MISKKDSGLVWLAVLVAIVGVVGVGYSVFQSNTVNDNAAISQETNPEKLEGNSEVKKENTTTGTTITTGDSAFGSMLFNDKKQAIYIWELENSTKAECYGHCAEAWPPVLTDGAPIAAGSVNGALLGTTERTDGTTQVTYSGHPLYYYAHEEAGEVKCHNVSTHGVCGG